jgi:hypothetical protein
VDRLDRPTKIYALSGADAALSKTAIVWTDQRLNCLLILEIRRLIKRSDERRSLVLPLAER